jgi:hypothetical protein
MDLSSGECHDVKESLSLELFLQKRRDAHFSIFQKKILQTVACTVFTAF